MTKFNEANADEVYQMAVDKWGVTSQVDIALEELAECSLAVSKLFKRDWSQKRWNDLASEIADVRIVLEQVNYILRTQLAPEEPYEMNFDEVVEEQYIYKLNRLAERAGYVEEE